jgi:hypothetical protein
VFRRRGDPNASGEQAPRATLVLPGALKINTWYRVASLLLGLAGLGSGGTAVFLTHVEAGPVALLAVGLLFLLIAMAGQLPTRIRIGDNEAEWQAVGKFVETVVEDSSADRPELLEALADLAVAAPRATSSALGAVAYELMISNMLHEFVSRANETGEDHLSFEPSQTRRGFDGLLIGPRKRVGVEIKAYSKGLPRQVLYEIAGQFSAVVSSEGPNAVLLVSRSPLGRSAQFEVADQFENFYVAVVEDSGDRETLESAARAALGLDETGRYFHR